MRLSSSSANKARALSYHSYCIPKTQHIRKHNLGKVENSFGFGGEDSFFALKARRSNGRRSVYVGVADGVGSWRAKKAKDAARYAQELMRGGMEFVRQLQTQNKDTDTDTDTADSDSDSEGTPRRIAEFAAQRVNEQLGIVGASTLCVLSVDSNDSTRELSAFNLGDSAFCIYREEAEQYGLIYRSTPQEQGFGVPYQLGSHETANRVEDGCSLQKFALHSGDVVVLGTDGLWDNMWEHEVADIICGAMTLYRQKWTTEQERDADGDVEPLSFCNFVHAKIVGGDLTHKLMKQAHLNSNDKAKCTPWSTAMTETVDMVYNGGKQDDITCIVLFVH